MSIKIIGTNKRAHYDYSIKDTYEAGLVLQGTEVKSLRLGKVSLTESFISIDSHGEVYIYNMSIPQYEFGNRANHQEGRKRKLLLHRLEINKIHQKLKTEGLTLVPTKIYFKDGRVKIEIALAKGKKLYDKRQSTAQRDVARKLSQRKFDE